MLEQLQNTRKVPLYNSRFDEFTSQVEAVERFRGSGREAISTLEETLQDKNGSFYSRILLVHELEKLVINKKIKATEENETEMEKTGFDAIVLSLDLATSVYYEDSSALPQLHKFKEFIQNSSFEEILSKKIVEEPDPAIMPEYSGTEDFNKAQDLLKLTGGAPILGLGIGIRGWRREFDQFLGYKSQSDTPDSCFWPLRCSSNYGDFFPKLSEVETQYLLEIVNGRKIVVFCPADRFFINLRGKTKCVNRLQLSKDYFSRIVFGTEREPAKVIPIPITLVEQAPKNGKKKQIKQVFNFSQENPY